MQSMDKIEKIILGVCILAFLMLVVQLMRYAANVQ